jgi:hypothetical protein
MEFLRKLHAVNIHNLPIGDLYTLLLVVRNAAAMLRVTNAALRACSQKLATSPGIPYASNGADVQCLFNHIRCMQVVCVRNAAVLSRIQKIVSVTECGKESCQSCCMMRRVHAPALFWSPHRAAPLAESRWICAHLSARASAADHSAALGWQHPGSHGGASCAII